MAGEGTRWAVLSSASTTQAWSVIAEAVRRLVQEDPRHEHAYSTEVKDAFADFEAQQIDRLRAIGRESAEVMLAVAERRKHREMADRFKLGDVEYRMSAPEARSFMTWFGTVRYARSYARPIDGGPGGSPGDAHELRRGA